MIRAYCIFVLLFVALSTATNQQSAYHTNSEPQMTSANSGIQIVRFLQPTNTVDSSTNNRAASNPNTINANNAAATSPQKLSRQQSMKRLQDQLNQMKLDGDNNNQVNKPLQFGSLPSKSELSQTITNLNQLQNQNQNQIQNQQIQFSASSSQDKTSQLNPNHKPNQVPQPTTPPAPPKILVTQIDGSTVGKGFKVDDGKSYQRIQLGNLLKKYLFIDFKLSRQAQWQKVNIVVTKQGQATILADCTFQGQYDACYISKQQLQANSVLFVSIKCEDDCNYAFKPRWSDLQILQFGQQLVFVFGEDKTQLFQVNLDKDQDFQQIRIHLTTRATLQPFSNAKMYVRYGNKNPTEDQYDVKSLNLWEDGQGIFLTKKMLKERTFMLLLIGQSQTTYRLSCQKIEQSIHQISSFEHIYEYLDSNSVKTYFVNRIANPNISQYSFKFSILSGQAQVLYFSDEKLTKRLQIEPFQYMKDSQYVIPAHQIIEIQKGIYIKVTTKDRIAMYTIKYVARQSNVPIELNEHVYGFVPFLPINKVRYAYFNYKQWIQSTDIKSDIRFTVNLIHVIGKITPQFRLCNGDLYQCTNSQMSDQFTTIIPIKTSNTVSQKETLQFSIADKSFKEINGVQKQANIIVKFYSKDAKQEKYMLAALQFINKKKVLYLRENRPLEESLYESQERHYKYVNSDNNVVEIRVFVNVIQGKISLQGSSLDKKVAPSTQKQYNTLIFTKDLDKPIVVIVTAKQKSIYGIHMQIVHKSNPYENANFYTIGQDLVYNVKINPLTYSVFEVIPMFRDFFFKYESSQSVIACVLNQNINKCIDVSKDQINQPKLSVKQTITNVTLSNRKARIKITNPFADSIAAVSVIFHSRVLDHCQRKKLGKIYSESFSDKQCVEYDIDETQINNLELYVSKRQFLNMQYTVYLCENSIQKSMSQKIIKFTPNIIKNFCTKQRNKLTITWDIHKQDKTPFNYKVKVDFVAQYQGSSLLLPEGVSYSVLEPARVNFIKYFRYYLINQFALKLILRQTRGFLYGYAKLISIEEEFNTVISNVNFAYSTQIGVDYNLEPTILISQEEIKSKGIKQAVLLIAIYADNAGNQNKMIDFDIQVIQKYQVLTQNNALAGFLEAGSIAYYTYTPSTTKDTTLFLTVSDHNALCTNIYLSYNENVGPQNFIASSLNKDFMPIRHQAGTKKYFFAIQATKVCDYSLQVFGLETSISYLQRGRQRTIRIAKGTVLYFVLESHNEAFKIFTMLKFGQVKYYLKKAQTDITKQTFTTDELDYKSFDYSNQESNSLDIDEKSQIFCSDCKYFLAVLALQNTEGTIVLASPINVITLPKDKYFSDSFSKKGSNTILSYKRIEKTNLKVTVHKGQIEIVAQYLNERINTVFQAKSEHQNMILDFKSKVNQNQSKIINTNHPSETFKVPINIFITGELDKTSYTIRASRSQDYNKINLGDNSYQFHDIAAGEPNHISLADDTVTCLKGFLRDVNEAIIITSNNKESSKLQKLIFDSRVNNKAAKTNVTFIKNMITLKLTAIPDKESANNQTISNDFQFNTQYQVCIKLTSSQYDENQANKDKQAVQPLISKQTSNSTDENGDEDAVSTLNIIVTQTNSLNILASDSEILIKGEATYVIHSDGQFIIDVFQCKGTAKLIYGKNLNDFKAKKLLNLESHSVSEQLHAIKVSSNQDTLYVKVNAELSVLRWLPLNYETDEGTGYFRFSAGNFRYSSQFKKIKLQYQQLQIVKPTKSTVQYQQYLLILADSQQKLERASKCQDYEKGVLQVTISKKQRPLKIGSEQYQSYYIDKSKLQAAFPNALNIYMNVVVKFVLKLSEQAEKKAKFLSPSTDDDEHYRFIYNKQQIPLKLYKQSQFQEIPYHYLFLSIFLIAGLFLLLTYLFTRKIVPLIARLKNSNLVQQNEGAQQEHQDDLQVPASSDRNQRVVEPVIETDQNMNK